MPVVCNQEESLMLEKKTKMPVQEPELRVCNFDEVAQGYTDEQAIIEA